MNKKDAKIRIEKLRKSIRQYRYLQYVKNEPQISSAALDSLKRELFKLEQEFPELVTSDSPTQRVPTEPSQAFSKVRHPSPMLSINDVFNREDIDDWQKRNAKLLSTKECEQVNYFCELKFDGVAIELIYDDWIFRVGATRGDGLIGEDVTPNIKTIESVPLRLRDKEKVLSALQKKGLSIIAENIRDQKEDIAIRGEVLITKNNFEKINADRRKEGLQIYANPRNLAAGSIRQLSAQVVAGRNLDFFAYAIATNLGQKDHREEHELLNILGFRVGSFERVCRNLNEVVVFFEEAQKKRGDLAYGIDGVVATVNSNEIFEKLGVTGKAPRGITALKFPLKKATTIVKDIKVQVGRTGVLTPVAVLDPVQVGGVTITRATLHNQDEIKRLGVKIGDTVIVGRAGDVIPDVVKVLPELRTGKEKIFYMPERCPICGGALKKSSGKVMFFCPSSNCSAKKRKSFYHFVSRRAFDIVGLGPQIIDKLLDQALVQDPADLFGLSSGDILPLENFQEKAAQNLVNAIQDSKKVELGRFIYALGIKNVGEQTSFDLAQRFRDLEALAQASLEELEEVPDIGPIVAQSIYNWLKDQRNKVFLEKLKKRGVNMISPGIRNKHLMGKTFVFSGVLKSMDRDKAKSKVRALGGEVSVSVSEKTDYIVVGSNPGSKAQKAQALGVKKLSENDFLKLII